jgi:hypothetical protein
MPLNGDGWAPTTFRRFVRSFGSALGTAFVETELGFGYLKGLGNPEGPHALACELVGSCLAEWLGAETLDFSLMQITPDDEIPFPSGGRVTPGTAFVSRAEQSAFPWGGEGGILERVTNPQMFTQLVVLDTWTRNCDRRAPDGSRVNLDNVLLVQYSEPPRQLKLLAMDFTHAFTCGQQLSRRLSNIENVRDTKLFGLFPEFEAFLDRAEVRRCATKLAEFNATIGEEILGRIPVEWEVSNEVRSVWTKFLIERAQFLAEHIEELIWTQLELIAERE